MKRVKVVCAIVLKDGKVLLAQRGKGQGSPLQWEFPGGKVKSGELETEALKREINEELSIQIEPYFRLSPVVDEGIGIELAPFVCFGYEGCLMLRVHQDIAWTIPHRIFDYPLSRPDLPIAVEFCKYWETMKNKNIIGLVD